MIYVTAKRLSPGGYLPEHITHLQEFDPVNQTSQIWTKQQMVNWIDGTDGTNRVGDARVRTRIGADVKVLTVHPHNKQPYCRTAPNDTTADNLLSLPNC